MRNLTSATLLLLASTLATAAEPEAASNASLVLAYNGNSDVAVSQVDVKTASQASADRVLERTLGLVSANLSFELDEKIAEEMPTVAK